jgi:hypothetical protein
MATYKVLQDIEAEDKFVGPLTLKQFILACITVVSIYLCFFLLTKHLWWLDIPLIPIILFCGFLAFPWGRDQPTEVWLLGKLRFFLKPRRRIWDQSGMQELVTVTAPKHVDPQFIGDNLSQTEVRSRLRALADTIDSRGWAIKNVNVNLYADPSYGAVTRSADRLVDASTLTQEVPNVDIQAADDILDEQNNPTAQHLDKMINATSQNLRQSTLQKLQDLRDHKKPKRDRSAQKNNQPPADFWFMNQPAPSAGPKNYVTLGGQSVIPDPQAGSLQAPSSSPLTSDEQKLLDKMHQEQAGEPVAYGHTRVIHPLDKPDKSAGNAKHKPKSAQPAMTQTPDPAILNLANNDDLSVATIARQANQKREPEPPKGEIVIPLR